MIKIGVVYNGIIYVISISICRESEKERVRVCKGVRIVRNIKYVCVCVRVMLTASGRERVNLHVISFFLQKKENKI